MTDPTITSAVRAAYEDAARIVREAPWSEVDREGEMTANVACLDMAEAAATAILARADEIAPKGHTDD